MENHYFDSPMQKNLYDLLQLLLSQIPDDSYLYVGTDIYNLIEQDIAPEILNFVTLLDYDYKWYSERFVLSKKFKDYLLIEDNYLLFYYYFCHFMIRDDRKIYIVVFDGCHFDIDTSIKIPKNILGACEREFEMDFTFSNPVTL